MIWKHFPPGTRDWVRLTGIALLTLWVVISSSNTPDINEYHTTTSVRVLDSCYGEIPSVDADGSTVKQFRGDYRVLYWDVNADRYHEHPKPWKGVDFAFPYRVKEELYPGLWGLDQWAGTYYIQLPPGKFQIITQWRLYHRGAYTQKEVVSNPFTVYATEECPLERSKPYADDDATTNNIRQDQ